ncbi:ABC transporter ATP-binding protein [Azoarcus taiwanensis]|uniref:ATP-binding cassette domain-containing protein n=1 Tax=Azoarcus taiwanensis TaxID=666964 RepID=A0A972FB34_9RHOO|nr:ABC transporter ATP-binding protein [Azoarcus taiwanensis]NMG02013.1 ATP-binding cassette domain-containing protein [Azoarcus taiwanensis]
MDDDTNTREASAIAIADLTFAWPGAGGVCLDVPDFKVSRGERVFMHGPSGSGKSTLLSLVAGVLEPGAGRIVVLGQDLAALSARARDRYRAANIGFVFQMFNLVPYLTALDNILLPCRFSCERVSRLEVPAPAEARRLAERLDLEAGLLDRPASELSVGQQQRVAAARALIGRPGLVIADEPTSALDADRQQRFLDLLLAECDAAGTTLLFVSHDHRLSRRFERLVELRDINHVGRRAPG